MFCKTEIRMSLAGRIFLLILPAVAMSHVIAQTVTNTNQTGLLDAKNTNGSLIGIQYEHWFDGPDSFKTAEAIPLLGKYTTDETLVAKHYAEFKDLGIDWLLIDWSNELWMKPAWEGCPALSPAW